MRLLLDPGRRLMASSVRSLFDLRLLVSHGHRSVVSPCCGPMVPRCPGPVTPYGLWTGDDGGRSVINGAIRLVQHGRRLMIRFGRPVSKSICAQDLKQTGLTDYVLCCLMVVRGPKLYQVLLIRN